MHGSCPACKGVSACTGLVSMHSCCDACSEVVKHAQVLSAFTGLVKHARGVVRMHRCCQAYTGGLQQSINVPACVSEGSSSGHFIKRLLFMKPTSPSFFVLFFILGCRDRMVQR